MSGRADRLVALLDERGLDCLLVSHLVNVRWLTGFTGTNGACLVSRDERLFFTDFRYVDLAKSQVREFELVQAGREMLDDLARRLSGRTGFDDAHVSVRTHAKLTAKLPEGVELVPAGGLVERLRAVKDDAEVRAMHAAAQIADAAYADICERGLAGRSERQVGLTAVRFMEDAGAEGPAFPPIVAAAENGARPHAVPRGAEIPRDTLVVVDMGAVVDGYCSDCTRTFATGSVGDEALEVYELVRATQSKARDAVRAGAVCREVDAVARDAIAAAGHGEHFGHGLGHGVGLEVHEDPRLARSVEGSLEAGNTVTVEPGIYLPGRFGVRIEDLVVVTDEGCRSLTAFPKELVTLP
jgi:Xaa-Pro aminopeptidase